MKKPEICLMCAQCNKEFFRPEWYINDKNRAKTKNLFCCKVCAAKYNANLHKKPKIPKQKQPKSDVWLGLRKIVKSARRSAHIKSKHSRVIKCTLGIKQVEALWNKQHGKCAISGLDMVVNTDHPTYNQVSIDRINPNLGYTIDNIRLICLIANYALNRFSDDELIIFCKAVAK